MKQIGVFDYGIGNLRSVANALSEIGMIPVVTSDPAVLEACDRCILPGVGAFPFGMAALRARGLDLVVRKFAETGRPLLGICLGMQLLCEASTEFELTLGLGIVNGTADRLRSVDASADGPGIRLPHVGWIDIRPTGRATGFAARLLARLPSNAPMYFVHSYGLPVDASTTIAGACYSGSEFAAVVAQGTIVGTQFHPEKSGAVGLGFLDDFCRIPLE